MEPDSDINYFEKIIPWIPLQNKSKAKKIKKYTTQIQSGFLTLIKLQNEMVSCR